LLPRANSIQTLVFLLTSKPLFQPPSISRFTQIQILYL